MLLAFAAVATAWSSYQANRWNGETTKASSRVNALRIDAARAQGLAQAQTQVDIAMYFQWVNATETDEPDLAEFYDARFRPEFRPAFDAWLATDPLTNPDAPPTPFAMDDYQLQARADAERLDAEAEVMAAVVRRNIQRSANYVLAVVLFAVALFFAGMSTKLSGAGTRKALLVVGCLVFIGTAAWIATFPISVSVSPRPGTIGGLADRARRTVPDRADRPSDERHDDERPLPSRRPDRFVEGFVKDGRLLAPRCRSSRTLVTAPWRPQPRPASAGVAGAGAALGCSSAEKNSSAVLVLVCCSASVEMSLEARKSSSCSATSRPSPGRHFVDSSTIREPSG